jgi:hypothetical protein
METVFPPGWFNVMQHLLVHLPWEARVGGLVQFRWMYGQERELKNLDIRFATRQGLRGVLRRHSHVKRLQTYQSCIFHVPTMWYHVVRDVSLSELSIFQWKGKGVGAPSAHYVTDKKWNYSMLYMYMNMEEVEPYFKKFDKTYWTSRNQPTLKQLDLMREHGLKGGPSYLKWFRQHVIYLFVIFLS